MAEPLCTALNLFRMLRLRASTSPQVCSPAWPRRWSPEPLQAQREGFGAEAPKCCRSGPGLGSCDPAHPDTLHSVCCWGAGLAAQLPLPAPDVVGPSGCQMQQKLVAGRPCYPRTCRSQECTTQGGRFLKTKLASCSACHGLHQAGILMCSRYTTCIPALAVSPWSAAGHAIHGLAGLPSQDAVPSAASCSTCLRTSAWPARPGRWYHIPGTAGCCLRTGQCAVVGRRSRPGMSAHFKLFMPEFAAIYRWHMAQ